MSTTRKPRIVLGVTGSISAVKSQSIALALKHVGFDVRVAMTHSAQKVIGESALRAVSEEGIYSDMWLPPGGKGGELHIEWGDWADCMLIAPATASCLAALWLGQFDSPVTLVAGTIPMNRMIFAPAMASEMWMQPSVQRNVADLKGWGATFLGPIEGKVASGKSGGRLMEPRKIAEAMAALSSQWPITN